ncbi:MAG: molecular chaperone [Idiomarina sp.]|uniref:OmpH family outer membrane protein n=1 Tax=Idiomarina sp. TaxID=1874361 RepID=UPI000C0DB80F|nr:OmpH family outer membrane protein [Idiomarina sp.]MAK71147.1 molecular chaperone [Idiomarinaceae bacterium]MBT41568.1 molecular chaperone [Idiomarina sp.]PHQ77100.1 MAG: molecular chaperone [Idiomarina sp.]HAD48637.1 molecular chaperone [Idiomarina sp.]
MKTLIKTTAVAVALSTALFAGAAEAQQKIGVVDMMSIFQQLPQREQISQDLQAEFEDRFEEMRQLEQKVQELRQKQERDAAIMSNQEKTQLNRELEQLISEAQLKQKALQEDTRRRQQEERNELLGQVQQAINAVAQDEGYDLVLESNAVAFMKADNDLSDEVVTQMSSGN